MKVGFAGIKQGWREYWAVYKVLKSKWHGSGFEAGKLEKELAEYIGTKYALTVNSGSSGLLLALTALELPKGSEVLTSACGFPATLAPIIHLGLKPILVDYDLATHNIDIDQVERVLKDNNIKAMIIAHTMGIPVDLKRLMRLVEAYHIKLIEDCCEALGAKFDGQAIGSFGDLGVFSFYPSHQINGAGMGGAVVTNNKNYALQMRSLRNWGKIAREPYFIGDHKTDFKSKVDNLPYDEQYIYQTIGYNMLMPDINCAYARVQLSRLPDFIKRRRENWLYLNSYLPDKFITLQIPPRAEPSYFGFTLTFKDAQPLLRDRLSAHLEKNGIRTRPFFAGNITKHPPYQNLAGYYPVADYLMQNSLFVGVWPGIGRKEREFMVKKIKEFNG